MWHGLGAEIGCVAGRARESVINRRAPRIGAAQKPTAQTQIGTKTEQAELTGSDRPLVSAAIRLRADSTCGARRSRQCHQSRGASLFARLPRPGHTAYRGATSGRPDRARLSGGLQRLQLPSRTPHTCRCLPALCTPAAAAFPHSPPAHAAAFPALPPFALLTFPP